VRIANIITHLVFLMQIIFFFFDFSQSQVKAIAIILVCFAFTVVMSQNSRFDTWKMNSLHESGLVFMGYYLVALILGLAYGYSFAYVAVNIMWVLPLFLVVIVPRDFEVKSVLNIVLFYAAIASVLSFVELLVWKDIGWLRDHVFASYDENGISQIVSDEYGIKAFGFFQNSVSNGLLLIFGFIILLERIRYKFNWGCLVGIIAFTIAIFFTYTRNNYLVLLFSLIVFYLIHRVPSITFDKGVWRLTIIFYISVLCGSVIFTLVSYGGLTVDNFASGNDSVQARVISWGMIFNDYLIAKLSSYHIWLGYGLTQLQNDTSPEKTYWVIDNSLLMVYLSSGLLGCALFLSWIKNGFILLQRVYFLEDALGQVNIRIAVLALSSYVVYGLMNATVLSAELLMPLMLVLSRYARQEVKLRRRFILLGSSNSTT
jgi:hypothetical protein